jgi:hypothetical protein
MKIPYAKQLPFIICGLSFLQPAMTAIQYQNICLIATALILGGKMNLTQISCILLKEKCVSTLSHFLSDAKISTHEMQNLYILNALKVYKINNGYFIIDDTMKHHSNFCKWIHGVFFLFDHALGANVKATCIVVLYHSDGVLIKFPVSMRIFIKEKGKMPWLKRKLKKFKTKNELAIEMIEQALNKGFPECTVLADAWFGVGPFIKELQRLNLSYILEAKQNLNIKEKCKTSKLTKTGRLAKNQYDLIKLPKFFESVRSVIKYGFIPDEQTGQSVKTIYSVKIATLRFNSIPGKHRVIRSYCPAKSTVKFLLTNELTWEASKIISSYGNRWIIEEFFRNAKQLTDMEGVTVRSEQGVTIALYLVFYIDFLVHNENYKRSIAGELSKAPLTVPSVIRRLQYENMEAFIQRVQEDDDFVIKWIKITKDGLERNRKKHKKLITISESDDYVIEEAV